MNECVRSAQRYNDTALPLSTIRVGIVPPDLVLQWADEASLDVIDETV